MQKTKIQWCNYTANPIRFCDRVEPYLDEAELRKILRSRATGASVFLCDMTDLAGEWVVDEWLDRVLVPVALKPDLGFVVLTKRPQRMAEHILSLTGERWNAARRPMHDWARQEAAKVRGQAQVRWLRLAERIGIIGADIRVPFPNLYLGYSASTQAELEAGMPHLMKLAAQGWRVGLSLEPLLGEIDLSGGHAITQLNVGPLSWVLVGGESGPGPRPCDVEWIRGIVRQCKAVGVTVFVKQIHLNGKLSHNPAEWPEDLRVRQLAWRTR